MLFTRSSCYSEIRDVAEMNTVYGHDFSVIFQYEIEEPQHPCLSEACGRQVVVPFWILSQFYYEQMYLNLGQIVDPSYPLRDVKETHSKESD